MANYKGSLPSGKGFSSEKEDKKQSAAIRKAAAAEMATKTSPFDVVGDIAPYVGAAIGGYFGGPAGAQAGYQAGSAVGGAIGGDKEKAEATYQEAAEAEMAVDNPEAAAQMQKQRSASKESKEKKSDPFAQALALYEKYQKGSK